MRVVIRKNMQLFVCLGQKHHIGERKINKFGFGDIGRSMYIKISTGSGRPRRMYYIRFAAPKRSGMSSLGTGPQPHHAVESESLRKRDE